MSSGFEIVPKQEAQVSEAAEASASFGRELVRALDERYLGQFVVETLATLDKTAAKALKKMAGRDTSAG